MKKFVSMIVASVLLFTAMILPANVKGIFSSLGNSGVKSGKGNGTNEKIETVTDTEDVVDSAVALINSLYRDGSTYASSSYDSTPRFESLSLIFERDAKTDVEITGNGISTDVSVSMKNTCDYRMNNNGEAHVIIDGTVNMSSRGSSVYMDFEAEIYMSSTKSLMRFTRLNMTMDGEQMPANYKKAILNKWIDLTYGGGDFANVGESIMQTNYAVLNIFDDYITEYASFDKKGSVYTMTGSAFDELMQDMIGVSAESLGTSMPFNIETEGEMKVDLSKATAPKISLEIEYDYPDSFSVGGNTVYIHEGNNYENISYKFYNINNTVIDFDVDNDDIYTMSEIEALVD